MQDKETLTISSLNVNPTPVGAGFFRVTFCVSMQGARVQDFSLKIVIGDILPFNTLPIAFQYVPFYLPICAV